MKLPCGTHPWIGVASRPLLEPHQKPNHPGHSNFPSDLNQFLFLYTSFPQLWEVFKAQQLTFRLPLLMALLGNSLQRASISSAEGSTSEARSAAAVSVARRGIASPSPHFGLSPSVSPPSLWAASGGLFVVWPALIKWNAFVRPSWNVEWLWEINSSRFGPSAF